MGENTAFLSERQLKTLLSRLNGGDPRGIVSAEWELVVMNGLSKLGKIEYEPGPPNSTKPDVAFRLDPQGAPLFVADISAVSDRGIHDANPIKDLQLELWKEVEDKGLEPRCFSLKVGAAASYKGGDKVRLRIPPKSRFKDEVFGERFQALLVEIAHCPLQRHTATLSGTGFSIGLGYDPTQRYFSMNHPVFTLPSHGSSNPISHRLNAKAAQIERSGFKGTAGVILCDAGCDAFLSKPSWEFHTLDEIVKRFLNSQSVVGFVLALTTIGQGRGRYEVGSQLWIKGDEEEEPPPWVVVLERLAAELPVPVANPKSASGWLSDRERAKVGFSHLGGMRLSQGTKSMEVTISSRVLADLLAGRLSTEEFHDTFDRDSRLPMGDAFEDAVKNGLTIESISLVKDETETDDDWVTITYSGPDPAISPFRDPRRS